MDRKKMLEYSGLFSGSKFEEENNYQGNDLGAVWTKAATSFRVWAPTASQVVLNLYRSGSQEDRLYRVPMKKEGKGTWAVHVPGDLNGIYYTYEVTVDGDTKAAVDPYAKAVGVNGIRGMIIDLGATNPPGFTDEERPKIINATDAILYEIHIRDFSSNPGSGMKYQGKYLAFTETGAVNEFGESTGVDYLAELGVTHVHLLPAFDYMSVDENRLGEAQYNWGYDPKNFNVPEGSYATDPYHGEVRVKEFKQMVQALHRKGIQVVMDMVYNHTMESIESNFNRIVPGYYYRLTGDGSFSNASGCGNETASERFMMRKFIIDSVLYWAKEYHIDGFRFDLMAIHDIQTMNEIRRALKQLNPGILLYGEGWTGGASVLPDWKMALKRNIRFMDPGIAAFNDNYRDIIKGSVFHKEEQGYISGRGGLEEAVKMGVAASSWHPNVDYGRIPNYHDALWAVEPYQTVNYVSAHDNLTLWDKLMLSAGMVSNEERVNMNLLAAAIIFTSQGIPFFQAGGEFLRSKPLNEEKTVFEENSYRSSDKINSLKWKHRTDNKEVVEYYKGLIAFRKANPELHLPKAEEIREKLKFLDWQQPNVIAFVIARQNGGSLCVIYNADPEPKSIQIPEGSWNVYVKGRIAGTKVLETLQGNQVIVPPISAFILRRDA